MALIMFILLQDNLLVSQRLDKRRDLLCHAAVVEHSVDSGFCVVDDSTTRPIVEIDLVYGLIVLCPDLIMAERIIQKVSVG